MNTILPKLVLETICAQYEEARKTVIGDSVGPVRPNGYAVLVRHGLLTWMNITVDGLKAPRSETARSAPAPWAAEIEDLLANIILERMEA